MSSISSTLTPEDLEAIPIRIGSELRQVFEEALANKIEQEIKPDIRRKSYRIAELVKKEFIHAWNAYKTYAWGHDELKPLSKTYNDWCGVPLGLSIVDSLDTLYVMGLDEEFENAVAWVEKNLNFNVDASVQVFEMTIRWLGGLISGYLISGSKKLLDLAVDLANRLLPAFNSPTGMPYRYVNLRTGATSGNINYPAEICTLMLEFGMLSKLTGDNTYYTKARNAMDAVYSRRSSIELIGESINVDTGSWVSTVCHINSPIDSTFEYAYKSWMLFRQMYFHDVASVYLRGISKYCQENYNGMIWYKRVTKDTGALDQRWMKEHSHFYPGLLALAGRINEAENFAMTCYMVWAKYGLAPDHLDYSNWNLLDASNNLYPEFAESLFHLWNVTGDDVYRMMAYTIFRNFVRYCRVDSGYTRIANVTTMQKGDLMDSYFLAETLKYLYLIFSDTPRVDYDDLVVTTEAHIMRGAVPV
jgi:hypothetical protein